MHKKDFASHQLLIVFSGKSHINFITMYHTYILFYLFTENRILVLYNINNSYDAQGHAIHQREQGLRHKNQPESYFQIHFKTYPI
jgi:hypothetical protein